MRNVLLTALLGLLMWDLWDQPAFTYMASLRRAERQRLIPATECVAEISRGIWDGDIRIGWTEGAAVASKPVRGKFFTNVDFQPYALTDGPNLIPLPWPLLFREEGYSNSYACCAVLQPPEDSAAAVLTLRNEDGELTAESVRAGDVFLFYVRPEPDEDGRTSISYGTTLHAMGYSSYELEFFDADGGSICRISG